MKRYFLFLGVCLLMACHGYAQNRNAEMYQGYVKYDEPSAPGTVTVLCSGFARKKSAESAKDAFDAAFYALLFRGIPGSQYELPMIPNEMEKKDDPVIKALLDKDYMSFVIKSSLQGEEKKVRKEDGVKGIMTTHKITINCDALRRYLEQNNVIRKFGI